MSYKSSSELKALAREQLKGKYGVPIGAILITGLISFAATTVAALFNIPDSIASNVTYYLICLIISLLSTVLSWGLVKFFMNFCKNQKYQISDIFWGFKNHPDKSIVASIVLILISLVCYIPIIVLAVVYALTLNGFIFLLLLLAIILGIVLVIIINLTYSLIYYILADEPNYSAIEALKKSREMMKGNKGRLFYINLSFIGWFILSTFTCYISLLWILPYRFGTMTYFYLDLKGEFTERVEENEYNSGLY